MAKKKAEVVEAVLSKVSDKPVIAKGGTLPSLIPEVVEPVKRDPILDAKIIQVRVYQAVSFDGGTHTTFIMEGSPSQRIKPVSVRIIPELLSIEIKNDRDQVLVPLTNVSGIYYESARYKNKKAEEAAEEAKKSGNSAALTDKTTKPR